MGSGQDVTYSPKFARYQKTIRDLQVERAEKNAAVRYLEKDLGQDFTCEMILDKLKTIQKKSKGRE